MSSARGAGQAGSRRGRVRVIVILAVFFAALAIVIVELSTEEGGAALVEVEGVNDAQRYFGGLGQEGDRLGDSDAPVTIQIFNDVQCDDCSDHFLETTPGLIEELVRTGRAKLLYRHYSFSIRQIQEGFIGARAAAAQDYEWNYIYLLFANQEEGKRVGVDSEFLDAIAGAIQELEPAQWQEDFLEGSEPESEIIQELEEQDRVATDLRLRAEPSAIVSGPAGTEVLQDSPSLEEILETVEQVE